MKQMIIKGSAIILSSLFIVSIFVLPKIDTTTKITASSIWADLSCPFEGPTKGPVPAAPPVNEPAPQCPDYFKWIHEDYKPWQKRGITREVLEQAKPVAHFRVIILEGRVYVETYSRCYQTRDVFTQWGILQLLSRYPGRVPDLELLFNCEDMPMVTWPNNASTAVQPAALFKYCGDESSADIVFPDWAFWGWAEVNIKPWDKLAVEMREGNKRIGWGDREPYAYWKGNPWVDPGRQDLLTCNVTNSADWNARLFVQDWIAESHRGFENSGLPSQCTYQYKIYIDGRTWSVSKKYILACDSPVLLVATPYYDFSSRGLSPLRHFWPIRVDNKCASIKYAVDWGRRHETEVQEMGKKASSFMFDEVSMDRVYDYMLHSLTEYAKLLKFKPVVPVTAVELSRATLACPAKGLERKFMLESEVTSPAIDPPCSLPPPMKLEEMKLLLAEREKATRMVEQWEKQSFQEPDRKP